jgi:hypothetical protein
MNKATQAKMKVMGCIEAIRWGSDNQKLMLKRKAKLKTFYKVGKRNVLGRRAKR